MGCTFPCSMETCSAILWPIYNKHNNKLINHNFHINLDAFRNISIALYFYPKNMFCGWKSDCFALILRLCIMSHAYNVLIIITEWQVCKTQTIFISIFQMSAMFVRNICSLALVRRNNKSIKNKYSQFNVLLAFTAFVGKKYTNPSDNDLYVGIIVVRLQSLQERQASRHNAAGDHRNLVEMAEQEVLYCPTTVFINP